MSDIGEVFRSEYVTVFRNGSGESVVAFTYPQVGVGKSSWAWLATYSGSTRTYGTREDAEKQARLWVGLQHPETYRPFASDEEFAPFRGCWVKRKPGVGNAADWRAMVVSYVRDGVYFGAMGKKTWQEAFDEFLCGDGTPFGVKV